jgi:molybdopterin-guanine dinucleotide biosynthesis protein A
MGFDKRALRWGAQTLAARACLEALRVTSNVAFLGDGNGLALPPQVTALPDRRAAGPGAALHAHLLATRGDTLVFAADMPFVHAGLLAALWDTASKRAMSLVAVDRTGQAHPTLAVYRANAAAEHDHGESPSLFSVLGPYATWPLPAGEEHAIDNVNTPDDWRAARATARALGLDSEPSA